MKLSLKIHIPIITTIIKITYFRFYPCKDERIPESKATLSGNGRTESAIWNPLFSNTIGIQKILANPNLTLEKEQEYGEYKTIKNDISRLSQCTNPATIPASIINDPKVPHARPSLPNVSIENVSMILQKLIGDFDIYHLKII